MVYGRVWAHLHEMWNGSNCITHHAPLPHSLFPVVPPSQATNKPDHAPTTPHGLAYARARPFYEEAAVAAAALGVTVDVYAVTDRGDVVGLESIEVSEWVRE